jgi:hypothetical protein
MTADALRDLIELVRRRARTIDGDALVRMSQAAREAVVTTRWASSWSAPHRPEPWFAALERTPGGYRPTSGQPGETSIGFDAEDRPRVRFERNHEDGWSLREVWEHDEHGAWLAQHLRGQYRLTLIAPGVTVWAEGSDRLGVERWVWRDGVAVRGDTADLRIGGRPLVSATEADVDADGALLRLRRGVHRRDHDDVGIEDEHAVDAVLAAIGDARSLRCDRVIWEAERDRAEPGLRSDDDLLAVLVPGLRDAVLAAVAASGVVEPFAVEVEPQDDRGGPKLPGTVLIGPAAFRAQRERFGSDPLAYLAEGAETGEVPCLDLHPHCDAETMRACRELNTALGRDRDIDDAEHRRAWAVRDRLGAALEAELGRTSLAVVRIGDHEPPSSSGPIVITSVTAPAVIAPTREGIAEAFRDRGFTEDQARRVVDEIAMPGVRLIPDAEADSRLGGDGLLPEGTAWPRTAAGRPLSFLAGLDLAELPATDVLPRDGWLLFWADLDDAGKLLGFIGEPAENREGADARVLFADAVVPASAPQDLPDEPGTRFEEVRVSGVAGLTLPNEWSHAELGFGAAAGRAYDELAEQLRYDAGPDTWVLGSATVLHPPEPDTVLLLLMPVAGFQDAGSIQFRIPADALAACDWSRVVADGG